MMLRGLLLATLFCSTIAHAVIETYRFSDATLEARYHRLSQELRCPKCQNQSIADSNAPISRDLRALLHQQLEAGASDEEILGFMVERYGEFVRYRPAVDGNTVPLWFAPPILILLGVMALVWHLRRQGTVDHSLTEAEQKAVRQRIDEESL